MVKLYLISARTLLILLCLLGQQAWAQTKALKGTVTSADDTSPLPGVTVLEKGTQNGTVTDAQGNFVLNVNNDAVLLLSFVGYATQEVSVGNQTAINVVLQPDIATLSEVVVIGYGTVKKEDATGSTATVDSRQFNKGVVNSPQELMQGKTAGVNITSISGAPGQTSTIRIRGGSSVTGSNDPLIIVDGVPISNDLTGGSANVLSMINPNDIESFSILKDASATAIYGLRASNGVIIITTKRGGSVMKLSYTGTVTAYSDPKHVKVYTGDQFRTLVNQLYPSTPAVTSILGTANTDWQKQIYKKPAMGQDHNLTVSGTALKTPYRVSLGYNDTDGILRTYNYKRTTMAISLDPRFLKDHLKVAINVKGMNNHNNFADQSAIANAVSYDPTQPVRNGNEQYLGYTSWTTDHTPNGTPNTLATPNPVAQLALTDNRSIQNRSIGNVKFDYQLPFLNDLHVILNLGYDYQRTTGHNNLAPNTQWQYIPTVLGGRYDPYTNTNKNQLLDLYVNYNKDLKSINSKVDFTGGYSFQHFYASSADSTTDAARKAKAISNNINFTEYYLVSFFGRLNYSFKNKYLVTGSLRDDATSRFNPSLRWGLFPSVAGKWKIMDEHFMQGSRLFSDLGARVGYGVTGQQDIGIASNYLYNATYTSSDQSSRYQLGNTFYNTLRPDAYNANIKWETTATYNVGIDYGFFKNRITGSVDVYEKKTSNLIVASQPAIGTNFGTSVPQNVGKSKNQGIEFNISSEVIATDNFQWTLGYNFTIQSNKITQLSLSNDPSFYIPTGFIGNTTGGSIQAQKVGYAKNSYLVYQQVYDKNGKPLEDTYVDRNHDGVINTADMYVYKQPNAKVFMGLNSRMNYKNWDFAFTGRLSLGNYNYNNVASNATYQAIYTAVGGGYLNNVSTQASDTQFRPALNTRFSDYYVQNASFFRMDNINFGYTIRNIFKEKGSVRVGLGVSNAFVITKYKGVDPEISGGIDNNFFPRSRSYFLNANFTF